MTKGKYAARAARRRDDQDVQAEIGTYQHQVTRLTAEVTTLTGKLAAEQAARKEETRRLRAQLDEGLSPELAAVREQLEQQRQRAVEAEAAQQRITERRDREMTGLVDLLIAGLGLSTLEAIELIGFLDPEHRGETYATTIVTGRVHHHNLNAAQVRDIEVARGERRPDGSGPRQDLAHSDIVQILQIHMAAAARDKLWQVPCDRGADCGLAVRR